MSSPVPIFGTQNLHDDDPAVIDSLVQESNAPPDLRDAMEPVPAPPHDKPAPITRIISGTLQLSPTQITQPFQLLPADANRKHLRIDVNSFAATPTGPEQYISVADEQGKVGTMGATRLRHGKNVDTVYHTGPVFVGFNPNSVDNIELTYWAITS